MAVQEAVQSAAIIPAEVNTPTPMDLLRIATNQGADIEKLEKLMQLQERWEANEARRAFSADFVSMKPHLPRVIRTKNNTETKSKYAPIEDINAAIDPILQQYGFSTATKVVGQDEKSVTVKAELWHRGGHVEETQISMPLDLAGFKGTVNKTGPHALSSSVTYGRRVALCALLNISTGDDTDGNAGTGTSVPGDWLRERVEWIANAGTVEETVKLFQDAYRKADQAKDKNAMKALIDAKNARKKELS